MTRSSLCCSFSFSNAAFVSAPSIMETCSSAADCSGARRVILLLASQSTGYRSQRAVVNN